MNIKELLQKEENDTLIAFVEELMEYTENYPQLDDILYDNLSVIREELKKEYQTPGTIAELVFVAFRDTMDNLLIERGHKPLQEDTGWETEWVQK